MWDPNQETVKKPRIMKVRGSCWWLVTWYPGIRAQYDYLSSWDACRDYLVSRGAL